MAICAKFRVLKIVIEKMKAAYNSTCTYFRQTLEKEREEGDLTSVSVFTASPLS